MSRTRTRTLETLVQILCILLLLALLVGVLLSEVARRAEVWHGERVAYATVNDAYRATAYFFRSEVTVDGVDNGPILYLADDGTVVATGEEIAKVYADGANAGTRAKALALCEELERLENALDAALPDYYGAYGALMRDLSSGCLPANGASTAILSDALDKRDAAKNGEAYRARIEELNAELAELIKNDASAFDSATAEEDGIFYRTADGYEAVMTPSVLATLTPGGLRALLASPQDTQRTVGKVVCDDICYFAITIPADENRFTVGEAYQISLVREGLAVNAMLDRVSDADVDGTVLLTFSCSDSGADMTELRFAEIEIACGEIVGLSLPMSAVYEEDGALITYVARDGVAKKCVLTPLYRKDGCLLVAGSDDETGLLVGDVIVRSTRRVYDGKVLK